MFSIIIPTFNNLEYLKLCLKSIKNNSSLNHEIIIFVNDGSDGTLEYLKSQNYKYKQKKINAGVCVAFNELLNRQLQNILFWLMTICIFVLDGITHF